jgi:hypothetical protein
MHAQVEFEDASHGAVFQAVFAGFVQAMLTGSQDSKRIIGMLQVATRVTHCMLHHQSSTLHDISTDTATPTLLAVLSVL